jgi:pantoate--beta-alanine ligase
MRLIRPVIEMQQLVLTAKREGKKINFVPTMGFLHRGHITLIEKARKNCDLLVISIFVNPLQFGAGGDYEDYPRDLTRDVALARGAHVDVLFAPEVREMYPPDHLTFVETELITGVMCGASRPGHFKGVTTIVTKLFNIVQPDEAYFGMKDAQQVIVIEKLVTDLNVHIKIVRVPTVREEDGLAMSSRNVLLSEEEREQAITLFQSLAKAKQLIEDGERRRDKICASVNDAVGKATLGRVDYVEMRDARTLQPQGESISGEVLIALAVRFGKTRLIDNIIVEV